MNTIYTSNINYKEIYIQYNFSNKNYIKLYKKVFSQNSYYFISLIDTLISLLKLYLYIYKYSLFNYKILFISSEFNYSSLIKKIALYSNNYYLTSKWKCGFLTNWSLYKDQLILLKWLNYLFLSNLKLLNLTFYNTSYVKYLYILYLKLSKKFKGIENLNIIPDLIFIINPKIEMQALKEAYKLNKIIMSFVTPTFKHDKLITFKILSNNYKFKVVSFILNILLTAHIHSKLHNTKI